MTSCVIGSFVNATTKESFDVAFRNEEDFLAYQESLVATGEYSVSGSRPVKFIDDVPAAIAEIAAQQKAALIARIRSTFGDSTLDQAGLLKPLVDAGKK